MKLSRLLFLLSLILGGSQGLVPFHFRVTAPSLRTQAFLSNLTIDCTTNDPNVTTKLYVRNQTGLPWKQLVAKHDKVLQRGQVYIILKFGLLDIGEYKCHATNVLGDVITSTRMVYGYRQNVPKFRVYPQKLQAVKIGSTAMFSCISEPYVKIKWFKVVKNRNRAVPKYIITRRKDMKEQRVVLRLIDVSRQDEGKYKCRMKYRDKVKEQFVELKLNGLQFLAKPKAPTTQWLSSNITFNCTTNNPYAKTAVYYRKYIPRNHGWTLLTLIPGRFIRDGQVYTLIGIGVQDTGQYQCRAWSKEGVLIRWPSSHGVVIIVPKINLDMSITPKLRGPVRPLSNHTITCRTTLLSARLHWFSMVGSAQTYSAIPRGKLIKTKNYSENKLVLPLTQVSQSDAGVYRCVMKYHGKKKALLTALHLGFKPKARSRKAIVVVRQGSRLVLPCTATGLPTPMVTWTKDGTSIGCYHDDDNCRFDRHYVIRNKSKKDKSVRSVLRIRGVDRSGDEGVYRCVAINKYGVHKSDTRVVILS